MRMEEQQETDTVPAKIANLLKEFNDIFEKPKGLPPHTGHKHNIQLVIGVEPFKSRLYRYPHFKKAEIKNC